MKTKCLIVAGLVLLCDTSQGVFAGDWVFGIGFQTGISRIEADRDGKLSPMVSGHLRALPIPYLAINGELGYSRLGYANLAGSPRTEIIPFELSGMFNFLPFKKVNPYVFIGGGGVWWAAKSNAGTAQDGLDSFLKTGGGLEFRVTPSIALNVGASFRYSLTEAFDQLFFGDENDQVLDVHAGFTYYFARIKNDRDRDGIPNELDLMPEIAEDKDGYMDHDGIPEKNPSALALSTFDTPLGNETNSDGASPVVIHNLVTQAELGGNIAIKAQVYSNVALRVVAALYRPIGTPNWNVVRLEDRGANSYLGDIPGYAVTSSGLEYCVVAVDETLSGIGYSGLPSKPVTVKISPSGKPWRIAGGAAGAAAIGTASYIVLRKQN
ncbi:MAG TPA: hypothetical protein VGA99_01315 [bacterium]